MMGAVLESKSDEGERNAHTVIHTLVYIQTNKQNHYYNVSIIHMDFIYPRESVSDFD